MNSKEWFERPCTRSRTTNVNCGRNKNQAYTSCHDSTFPTPPNSSSSVNSQESTPKVKKQKRKKSTKSSRNQTLDSGPFKFVEAFSGSKKPVYDVKFNPFITNKDIFATGFTNKVVIYECHSVDNDQTLPMKGTMKKLAEFCSERSEYFYTFDWSYDSNGPILAGAGELGVVHIFSFFDKQCQLLEGHTGSIYELKFHPVLPQILASGSRDCSVRLWNVKTKVTILLVAGLELKFEVLCVEFDRKGNTLAVAGMDCNITIWKLDTDEITDLISFSSSNVFEEGQTKFPTKRMYDPEFLEASFHTKYIDGLKFFTENVVVSKCCDGKIIFWEFTRQKAKKLLELTVDNCTSWYMRFNLDRNSNSLVVGDLPGQILLYDLNVKNFEDIKKSVISSRKSTKAIRNSSLSNDGSILIAVSEIGQVLRFKKVQSTNHL